MTLAQPPPPQPQAATPSLVVVVVVVVVDVVGVAFFLSLAARREREREREREIVSFWSRSLATATDLWLGRRRRLSPARRLEETAATHLYRVFFFWL